MNIKRLLAVILAVLALLSFVGCNVKKDTGKEPLNAASLLSKLRDGYDFKQASALDQVKKSRIPTLFIPVSYTHLSHARSSL